MAETLDPRRTLTTLVTFAGWSQEPELAGALEDLALRAEVWAFSEGDLIRFPDEASAGPLWVIEGCLVALETEGPHYTGVSERLTASPGVWVRGQTSGRFLLVPEPSWQAWLRNHPGVAERLGLPTAPGLPRGLVRSPLVLEPDEAPVHLFRKSLHFFFLRASVPALFFLLFSGFGLVLQFTVPSSLPAWALWFLPGCGMLVTVGLIALVAWEWSVSVLAITDRSVILRQVDVWAHRSDFEKLSLEKVQEAVFRKAGWTDALLGLVTLELEGGSPKGRLVFPGLAHTSSFLTAMEALRSRRRAATPGRRLIRQALAQRAGGVRSPRLERAAVRSEHLGPKPRPLSWRVERGSAVWFRRHPWIVVKRSLPWAGWMVLVWFLGFVATAFATGSVVPIALGSFLVSLIPLGRIGWEIWDWADDKLSLQDGKIILVHRRPLWLGEVRQEGKLDQVQQVGVRKDSLAALVLDFGVVTVSLGAGPPLEFTHAAHPEWVQNEIFHWRSLLSQEREQEAARDRLDEVSEILDTWDEARKAGYFSKEKEPS